MFFQKVLKGISGVTNPNTVFTKGIICNWWHKVGQITPAEIVMKLTERNLDWHLNHYDDHDPLTNDTFKANTPFISVTGGSVERDTFARRNVVFDPFLIALQFATRGFTTTGHIFYAHVFTLGRQSIELEGFSEEVRELNIYKDFLPFHPEGEITAKIIIPAPQIERWEEYDGPQAEAALRAGVQPTPKDAKINAKYAAPERYCNIRGLVTD